MPKRPPSAEAVRLRLAGLCARSEQCEYDLRAKISRAGLSLEEADDIIGMLRENKFIDDARFAGAFARDKARFAGWGPARIRQALMLKRIPSAIIAEAVDALEDTDLSESLMRAARAKARSLDLADKNDLMKLCRHLMSRGFSYDDFKKALRLLHED